MNGAGSPVRKSKESFAVNWNQPIKIRLLACSQIIETIIITRNYHIETFASNFEILRKRHERFSDCREDKHIADKVGGKDNVQVPKTPYR